MDLDLPTLASHPPFWGMHRPSSQACTPKNTFANVKKKEKFTFRQHVSLLNKKLDVFISF